jgi:hypothetical protein
MKLALGLLLLTSSCVTTKVLTPTQAQCLQLQECADKYPFIERGVLTVESYETASGRTGCLVFFNGETKRAVPTESFQEVLAECKAELEHINSRPRQ